MGAEPPGPGRPSRDGLDERQVRQIARVSGIALVVVLVLVFIVENSRQVRVSFVFFSAEISLIWVIALSVALGAAAGVLVGRVIRRRFGGSTG